MAKLTSMDELFVHQIPEPLPNVATHHDHWRESLFFIAHPRNGLGDVIILTLAHFPKHGHMDSLQLGRVSGVPAVARHVRDYDGDPHTMAVGPVRIDIAEPYQRVELVVEASLDSPLALELTFTARTEAYGLRRGTMRAGHELIWDQSHMVQSGSYAGSFTFGGEVHEVRDWWGQRDHSWGIRDHARCPLWMWLAIQLPEAMVSVWHWELPNGAVVYTDGCYAPADRGEPIPVVGFAHELRWLDDQGSAVSYQRDGEAVTGLAGHVDIRLEGGRTLAIDAEGRWAQRYGPVGGGLSEMLVRTADGAEGTAIYEVTGAHHHHFFPVARGERLPPDG